MDYIAINTAWCLIIGLIFSLLFNPRHEHQVRAKKWSGKLLKFSVVLIGATLNYSSVIKYGSQGFATTLLSLIAVFLIGTLFYRLFKIDRVLSILISAGTAICGGSAIAAIAPIIGAESNLISISMIIVFLLNAIAVYLFPFLGHQFSMGQEQFGTWAALAIHDTSSVVAACSIYGEKALEVGSTLKLTRALWIVPLSMILSWIEKDRAQGKIQWPLFIVFFLFMSLIFTFFNSSLGPYIPHLSLVAKTGLGFTLFMIGFSLDKQKLKNIGMKPLLYGVSLWLITVVLTLAYVLLI